MNAAICICTIRSVKIHTGAGAIADIGALVQEAGYHKAFLVCTKGINILRFNAGSILDYTTAPVCGWAGTSSGRASG